MDYAHTYALNYNGNYASYKGKGGDCANFASQCLTAGGLSQNNTWKPYTTAWLNANTLKNYLTSRADCTAYSTASVGRITIGDLVWSRGSDGTGYGHVMVVTAVSNIGINICGHTNDRNDQYCSISAMASDLVYHVHINSDSEKPVVTSAYLTNITPNGYDVVCSVSDNAKLAGVQIGTWNDVIGIDQAVWQSQNVSGSSASATFHVSISDLGGHQNTTYHSNVFAWDASGNVSEGIRAGDILLETEAPAVTEAHLENLTTRGYDVVFTAQDNVGVVRGMIGSWNDAIGIDAAKWQKFTIDAFPCRVHISIDDFDGAQNVAYHSNVYCCDRCGNVSAAFRAGDTVVPAMPDLSGGNVLRLPAGLKRVESEAFAGTNIEIVVVPASCQAIEARAFADCNSLKYVILPQGAEVEIAEDAFAGSSATVFRQE